MNKKNKNIKNTYPRSRRGERSMSDPRYLSTKPPSPPTVLSPRDQRVGGGAGGLARLSPPCPATNYELSDTGSTAPGPYQSAAFVWTSSENGPTGSPDRVERVGSDPVLPMAQSAHSSHPHVGMRQREPPQPSLDPYPGFLPSEQEAPVSGGVL